MKAEIFKEPYPYIVIDDFYDYNEYQLIWQELDFLTYDWKMVGPDKAGSASVDGRYLKNNRCIWIDQAYGDRDLSNILKVGRKLFTDERVKQAVKEAGSLFDMFTELDRDCTLLSYYDNATRYEPHRDKNIVTALYWTFRQPRVFSGGDLTFTDTDQVVELRDNRMLLFLAQMNHEVSEIRMHNREEPFSGLGRYCITNFIDYRDEE